MKNNFSLKYSVKFYEEFDEIISYIKDELKNVIAANNLMDTVEREINNRFHNPLGYKKYYTNAGNIYYRIYIKNYIVFYTVTDNVMEVRRITYSKRDLEKLMNDEEYEEYIENALDEADREAEDPSTKYYTHEEMMQIAKRIIDDKEKF